MSIAIIGAHRTGKSTLAAAAAARMNLPFVRTQVSEIFRDLGIDPAAKLPFEVRLEVQNVVLDRCCDLWKSERGVFITDRSPIDMAAYMLADINHNVGYDVCAEVTRYIDRCFDATNAHFSVLMLLQPGLPIVATANKLSAALNPAYIEHLNTLLMGLMYDPRCKTPALYVRREVLDLSERVNAVASSVKRSEVVARTIHGYEKGRCVAH